MNCWQGPVHLPIWWRHALLPHPMYIMYPLPTTIVRAERNYEGNHSPGRISISQSLIPAYTKKLLWAGPGPSSDIPTASRMTTQLHSAPEPPKRPVLKMPLDGLCGCHTSPQSQEEALSQPRGLHTSPQPQEEALSQPSNATDVTKAGAKKLTCCYRHTSQLCGGNQPQGRVL